MQSTSKFAGVRPAISRRLRQLSLRTRLALGLVLVAAVGLVVADIIVYDEIQSYLYGQVDQELVTALTPVKAQLSAPFATFSFGRATPPGTYGAAIDTSGVVKETPTGDLIGPPPELPQSLLSSPRTPRAVHFTTSAGAGSSLRYRVLAQPVILNFIGSPPRLGYAVVAIPLRSLDDTLGRLVTIDIIVSAVVLAALAAVGYVVVRVGMRPLAEIERTAGAIAAGDLSRRVERQDDRTEVGRLGASLNEMLAKIEHAFSEQRASEDRLRQFLADASHEL
ncbi:MAG TPA: HAMP domain-containing protein, partial [Acidimicrobiales bacterium]|nr:HAMP domain-containing protein [Acidimicrobiales bacterium]